MAWTQYTQAACSKQQTTDASTLCRTLILGASGFVRLLSLLKVLDAEVDELGGAKAL